jgi:hypothetical protein
MDGGRIADGRGGERRMGNLATKVTNTEIPKRSIVI